MTKEKKPMKESSKARAALEESSKARAALEEYLLMGPDRSLAKLAQTMGKPLGYVRTLKEWSTAFGWVAKAQEYDREQALAKRRKHEAQLERMNEEHLLWGHTQALRAMEIIADLSKQEKFSPQSATQLFKVATDLQRLAADSISRQLVEKESGLVEVDYIIRTVWGRGTDPRRVINAEAPSTDTEEPEIRVEFGKDTDE